MGPGVLAQAGEGLGIGAGDARRRVEQALAIRVLADRDEDLAHRAGDPVMVHPEHGGIRRRGETARLRGSAQDRADHRGHGLLRLRSL